MQNDLNQPESHGKFIAWPLPKTALVGNWRVLSSYILLDLSLRSWDKNAYDEVQFVHICIFFFSGGFRELRKIALFVVLSERH